MKYNAYCNHNWAIWLTGDKKRRKRSSLYRTGYMLHATCYYCMYYAVHIFMAFTYFLGFRFLAATIIVHVIPLPLKCTTQMTIAIGVNFISVPGVPGRQVATASQLRGVRIWLACFYCYVLVFLLLSYYFCPITSLSVSFSILPHLHLTVKEAKGVSDWVYSPATIDR